MAAAIHDSATPSTQRRRDTEATWRKLQENEGMSSLRRRTFRQLLLVLRGHALHYLMQRVPVLACFRVALRVGWAFRRPWRWGSGRTDTPARFRWDTSNDL